MEGRRPAVALIGCGPTALSALESLAVCCDVGAVFRDAPVDDAVARLAVEHSVPLFRELAPRAVEARLRDMRPECVVISSYNRIVGPRLLSLCPFINVHYSPLPRYRGRANVNWAIINGEPCAAISIHTVAPGLDAGNLLFQRLIPIDSEATVSVLYDRLNRIQQETLGRVVLNALAGHAGEPQSEAEASYCCARTPEDGEIDWTLSTTTIRNLIRALQPPYPFAYTFLGCERLSVVRASACQAPQYAGRIPGRVVRVDDATGWVDILTGDGVLRVYEVMREGCPACPAASVVRSTKDTLGLKPRDLLIRIDQLAREIRELEMRLRVAQAPDFQNKRN